MRLQKTTTILILLQWLLLLGLSSASLLAEGNSRRLKPIWQEAFLPTQSLRLAATQPTVRERRSSSSDLDSEPWLTIEISEPNPYLKQPVPISIRITRDRSLASVSIHIPEQPQLTTEPLGIPKAKAIFQRGRHRIVTEYHYIYTPLESGDLALPVIEIQGKLKPVGQFSRPATQPFQLQGPKEERWQVRPAAIQATEPWLPLQSLELDGYLEPGAITKLKKGETARYILSMKAFGNKGDDLPSLASTLQGADFEVILNQVQHSTKFNDMGQLVAHRTETYTLTPKHNGYLRIPSIGLHWWNLTQDRLEHTLLPTQTIKVKAEFLPEKEQPASVQPTLPEITFSYQLIGLFVALLLAIGWWILVGSRKISKVQWSDELYPTLRAKNAPPRKPLPQYVTWDDELYPTLRTGKASPIPKPEKDK